MLILSQCVHHLLAHTGLSLGYLAAPLATSHQLHGRRWHFGGFPSALYLISAQHIAPWSGSGSDSLQLMSSCKTSCLPSETGKRLVQALGSHIAASRRTLGNHLRPEATAPFLPRKKQSLQEGNHGYSFYRGLQGTTHQGNDCIYMQIYTQVYISECMSYELVETHTHTPSLHSALRNPKIL